MSFFVYMLKCSDGSYYIGHTDNLEMRLSVHQEGLASRYTAARLPIALAFAEQFTTRIEALERERQIKGWSRLKKDALVQGDWETIKVLAQTRGSTSSPRTEKDQ